FHTDAAELDVRVREFVIAGWSGRDRSAVEHHIEELAAIGVPRPSTVPLYYRASQTLLTQDEEIQILGDESSGEVEPVLLRRQDEWWLTVGSDHTDRALEARSVALAKQLCAKPIATHAWRWIDVADHADDLTLTSEIFEDGRWVKYQSGALAKIRPLMSLIDGYSSGRITDGLVMFCGTLTVTPNARGQTIRGAPQMKLGLRDPRRDRAIEHAYRITPLPVVS
ncbi:MAG: DUF2848 domain-containing protein, partial [Burkholderiaceae bacterium]